MQLSKKFKIPIYHTNIHIGIVDNVKKEAIKIYKKNKFDFSTEMEYRGLAFNFDLSKFYILFDNTCITHGLVAHEIDHTVSEICKVNSVQDDEARAFLTELITTEVYKFLKVKNIQVG